MTPTNLITFIEDHGLDGQLIKLYGEDKLNTQRERYVAAVYKFCLLYGDEREVSIFSVPGRSELSGNHTDHNRGSVIAASVNLDIIAVASARSDKIIRVKSEGYKEIVVDIAKYNRPEAIMFGTSEALIAGMSHGFMALRFARGGFDAYMTSDVLRGSGLSSSAAFEVMIGNIENHLYNNGNIDNVQIARLAQYAENVYFGKPCGLMDQVACAHGGIVAIDFADTDNPVIENVDFDIIGAGYRLCIVDTGGNHTDLTDDYAEVPAEMKAIAQYFDKEVLRELEEAEVIESIPTLRKEFGDRAILRALHFFSENKRVKEQKKALANGDIDHYFGLVNKSGQSSFCYLQNVYTTKNIREQGLSLALALADSFIGERGGAYRVHGGGFAGTIQAYVKAQDTQDFASLMDSAFGEGATLTLTIRPEGAVKII